MNNCNQNKLLLPLTPLWSVGCCTSATGHGRFHLAASCFVFHPDDAQIALNCLTGTIFEFHYQSILHESKRLREEDNNKDIE